jgi:hypothetical protein
VDADRYVLNAQLKRSSTISVGKLCVQPVDKPLRALWRKRVNKIGEKIATNIYALDWRKFHQSY